MNIGFTNKFIDLFSTDITIDETEYISFLADTYSSMFVGIDEIPEEFLSGTVELTDDIWEEYPYLFLYEMGPYSSDLYYRTFMWKMNQFLRYYIKDTIERQYTWFYAYILLRELIKRRQDFPFSRAMGLRTIIVNMMIATKFLSDYTFANKDLAKYIRLRLGELNLMEVYYLRLIEFSVYFQADVVEEYLQEFAEKLRAYKWKPTLHRSKSLPEDSNNIESNKGSTEAIQHQESSAMRRSMTCSKLPEFS